MKHVSLALRLLLKTYVSEKKATDSATLLAYSALLLTSGFVFAFGFGVIFALRQFGTVAFSAYLLLSYTLFLLVVPKAWHDVRCDPRWLSLLALPISESTWKVAHLVHFALVYGYATFLPLIFFCVWALLYQSFTLALAGFGIWLFSLAVIVFRTPALSTPSRQKRLTKQIGFGSLLTLSLLATLQPSQFQLFAWLQVWFTPEFSVWHIMIGLLGIGAFVIGFQRWQLLPDVTLQNTAPTSKSRIDALWHWQFKVLRTPGLLSQWLSNLALVLLLVLILAPQVLVNLPVTWQITLSVGVLFTIFSLFSPAWSLFSLIAPELVSLRALPFDWAKDYRRKLVIVLGSNGLLVLLVTLLLSFFTLLTRSELIIIASSIILLLAGQSYLAFSYDLANPNTHAQSIVLLLRPTWQRTLITLALTSGFLILLVIGYAFGIMFLFNLFVSSFITTALCLWMAIQMRKKTVGC